MCVCVQFGCKEQVEDKRKLLQTWVAEGENRQACESRVILTKESSNVYRGQRELVSIRDMILVKNWPMEKIRGIVARGGGVPDPDAPTVPALTQYWCYVSRTHTEEESVRQTAEIQVAAQTTSEGIGAMMGSTLPRGLGSAAVNQQQLDEITQSVALPGAVVPEGHGCENVCFRFLTV